jgi:hypothetical protein
MPIWEYRMVFLRDDTWVDSDGRRGTCPGIPFSYDGVYAPTGRRQPQVLEIADLTPLLSDLGMDGWELAGILGHEPQYRLLFKRPRL